MRPKHSIDWLDCARFAAAASVMIFHYTANGMRRGVIETYDRFGWVSDIAEYGYLGVDLFFIISGYVIALTCQGKNAPAFAISRFVRLWPTFLLCLVLTTIARSLLGSEQFAVGLTQFAVNTTMLAPYLGFNHVDSVYWTLSYELGFYGLVFAAIAFGQKQRLDLLVIAWLPVIALFDFLGADFPLVGNYNYLFVIGFLVQRGEAEGWKLRRMLPLLLASALAIRAAIERSAQMTLNRGNFELDPVIVGGTTAAFILAFFVFGLPALRGLKLPAARRLGLMTYPLYLLHAYFGYVVLNMVANEENKAIAVVGMALLVLALSYIVTKYFEEPLLPRLSRWMTAMWANFSTRFGSRTA